MDMQSLVSRFKASDAAIVAGNIFAVIIALQNEWGLITVAWLFWLETVVICAFSVLRVLFLPSNAKTSTGRSLADGKYQATVFLTVFLAAVLTGIAGMLWLIGSDVSLLTPLGELWRDFISTIQGVVTVMTLYGLLGLSVGHFIQFVQGLIKDRGENPGLNHLGHGVARIAPLIGVLFVGAFFGGSTAGIIAFAAFKTGVALLIEQMIRSSEAKRAAKADTQNL